LFFLTFGRLSSIDYKTTRDPSPQFKDLARQPALVAVQGAGELTPHRP